VGAIAAVALAAPFLCARPRFLMSLAAALVVAGAAISPGVLFFDLLSKQRAGTAARCSTSSTGCR